MKAWQAWVLCTIVCWGAYIPAIHHAQALLGKTKGALRTFLFVGVAYFITSAVILALLAVRKLEPMVFTVSAGACALFAGILGAVGALGIVFAYKHGGMPTSVGPLVFAGAPIVGTLVSMALHRPSTMPSPLFFLGILMAAAGAALVLANKPS